MDKQKKIILQVIIPIAVILLGLMFFLIFKYLFQDTQKQNHKNDIDIEFPDVKKNIESNKIKAYQNQENYERQDRQESSDLVLDISPDTISLKKTEVIQSSIPKNKQATRKKQTDLGKRLEIQAKMAQKEYQEFINEPEPEEQPPTIPQKPIVTIPPAITFNSITVSKQQGQVSKKEIYGYIHNEQTVINRSLVKIRTAEPIVIRNFTIPANTLLYGMCSLTNGRIYINIRSVPWQNRSIACDINVYDLNGFEGIAIHNQPEMNAHKKTGASTSRRVGTTLGSAIKAITGTSVAGEISGTLAEGVIKGTAEGTSDKINLNKATLTNNHPIILKIK